MQLYVISYTLLEEFKNINQLTYNIYHITNNV